MAAVRRASCAQRLLAFAAFGALAAWLAGCSMTQEFANIPHPGLQKDGSYVLNEQDQGLGCRQLQEKSLGLQEHMQQLSVQALDQMQQLPDTIVAAWKRLVGAPGKGVPAIDEYNEARAEADAVSRTMARKGCDPVTTASIKTDAPPIGNWTTVH
jgi:hypothetical protein